jgi:hypothetical protein
MSGQQDSGPVPLVVDARLRAVLWPSGEGVSL